MSHEQEKTIQMLMEAGISRPSAVRRIRERHQRANFKADVKPFASGLGWALAIFTAGVIIGAAGLVTAVFRAAGLFAEDQTVLTLELVVFAGGAAAAAYGLGYTWKLQQLTAHFNRRLYREDAEHTDYQPAAAKSPSPAVFINTDNHSDRIPKDIDIHDLIRFANALLNQRATLSEASAANYGLSRSAWETFRDWSLANRFIRWKDEANHRQGLEIAGPAGQAALRAIALGYYGRDL